ncbi:MAG: serine/threonine protein kinase [Myxococcales bacterium]|nr:serine/threonine protein kinase [Myxococcales bacterium]
MGSGRQRTIMGMAAIEVPDELRATLPDAPPVMEEPSDATGYRGWVGRLIDDRYRLVRLIAEGGMGAVYEARHVDGGPHVALKVMYAELGDNAAIVQRFAREVQIGQRVKHPNVVGALATGFIDASSPYLVLELVTGPTLSHAMWEQGAFPWRRAARIGAQVAAAIGAAWDAGFVHRDLKPDNIVLEPDGRGGETVKLLDFGIAHDRSTAGLNAKLTGFGEVLGTVGYMAPEQSVGQGVDVRSDLYAIGVLLWEMIAGFPLFDDDLEQKDYFLVQMREKPAPISELAADAPEALTQLVASLLALKQTDRPEDPNAVRDQLLALSERAEAAPAPAPPAAPPMAAPPMPASAPVPPPAMAPRSPPATSRTSLPILLAGIGLALFGVTTCLLAALVLFLR